MSETLSHWSFERSPEYPVFWNPQMMIGAATPLWGYFTGAALAGAALWWMSRSLPEATAVPAAREPLPPIRARVPALVVVESVEEPVLDAEFVEAPARPRRSKPAEVKP